MLWVDSDSSFERLPIYRLKQEIVVQLIAVQIRWQKIEWIVFAQFGSLFYNPAERFDTWPNAIRTHELTRLQTTSSVIDRNMDQLNMAIVIGAIRQ